MIVARRRSGVVVAVMLAALLPRAGAADVLCVRRSGVMVARPGVCRTRERPLALTVTGPPGPAGEPGTAGPPAGGVIIEDAQGAVVGAAVRAPSADFDGVPVVRRFGDRILYLWVAPTGFFANVPLSFTGPNCTGAIALEGSGAEDFVSHAAVVGETAYYGGGEPVDIFSTLEEIFSPNGSSEACVADGGTFVPPSSCCIPQESTGRAVVAVDLGSLHLVPPFRIPAP